MFAFFSIKQSIYIIVVIGTTWIQRSITMFIIRKSHNWNISLNGKFKWKTRAPIEIMRNYQRLKADISVSRSSSPLPVRYFLGKTLVDVLKTEGFISPLFRFFKDFWNRKFMPLCHRLWREEYRREEYGSPGLSLKN